MSELREYKQYVEARLQALTPFLQKYALGDFKDVITIPEEEDEFTELLVGISLMVEDFREIVTELKRTQNNLTLKNQELEDQARLVTGIAETAPALIYIYDLETQSNIYSNPGIERLLGYTPEEILSMGSEIFIRIIHPDDLEAVFAFQTDVMAASDEDILQIEYRMKHRDGSWRVFRSIERPYRRNSEGTVCQKIGIGIDISERRIAEAEMERFNRMAIGREHRMIELKREVNTLAEELGRDPPYDLSFVT